MAGPELGWLKGMNGLTRQVSANWDMSGHSTAQREHLPVFTQPTLSGSVINWQHSSSDSFSCVLVTGGAFSSNISHVPGPIALLQQKASPFPEMTAPSAKLKLSHSEIKQWACKFNPYYLRVTIPVENHQGEYLCHPRLDAMLHLSSLCKSLPEQGKAGHPWKKGAEIPTILPLGETSLLRNFPSLSCTDFSANPQLEGKSRSSLHPFLQGRMTT